MSRAAWLACAALLATLLAPGAARADVFGPIELASIGPVSIGGSASHPQQALYAHDPAISGNGRYVVFDGYFGGRTGVWRRELQPPFTVEPVAVGELQAQVLGVFLVVLVYADGEQIELRPWRDVVMGAKHDLPIVLRQNR